MRTKEQIEKEIKALQDKIDSLRKEPTITEGLVYIVDNSDDREKRVLFKVTSDITRLKGKYVSIDEHGDVCGNKITLNSLLTTHAFYENIRTLRGGKD